jgi:hypothetical protein
MAKKAASRRPAPAKKRWRGRPPKPGGPKSQVEVQRAYRPRLKAAGKVVKIVDAIHAGSVSAGAAPPSIPDFDPATQMVCDREFFERFRDGLITRY